ncbi:hypothetical protein GH714_007473 [Hevea brasiliensis]|uniref:Uncharacterized protein n=1 Tax=Hevea brasiliensis TaxID=3981 RepID=A0A6A6NG47_HEVBR|nr:hypothetical protein GH714_007473 [Hevea brasiliensis]
MSELSEPEVTNPTRPTGSITGSIFGNTSTQNGELQEFDPVHVQILGKDKLPNLNEVFSLIHAEESGQFVMLEVQPNDGSALISAKISDGRNKASSLGQGQDNKHDNSNSLIGMGSGAPTAKSHIIPRKIVSNFMQSSGS